LEVALFTIYKQLLQYRRGRDEEEGN